MLVGCEHVGDIGNKFAAVAHQRVLALLTGIFLALAGQHHGTHLEWDLLDVRNGEFGFKRADLSAFILPHHKLEVILAGREHEPGGVLDILAPHFL